MKRNTLVILAAAAAALSLAGVAACSQTQMAAAEVKNNDAPANVTCRDFGTIIYQGRSRGRIVYDDTGRIQFVDARTGRLQVGEGSCWVDYDLPK